MCHHNYSTRTRTELKGGVLLVTLSQETQRSQEDPHGEHQNESDQCGAIGDSCLQRQYKEQTNVPRTSEASYQASGAGRPHNSDFKTVVTVDKEKAPSQH